MICAEKVSKSVEADAEPGLGEVAVGLALGGAWSEQVGGHAAGPDDGERHQRHQEGKLARVGEAGVLEVEASWVLASPNMHSMAQRLR